MPEAILPSPRPAAPRGIYERTTRGTRIYLATPRLRGLLGVNMAVAAAGATVIVNTVVIVQGEFGLTQRATALALAAFGRGSMLGALALPRLLERIPDRSAILAGVLLLVFGLLSEVLKHQHRGLPEDDPHWAEGADRSGHRHAHAFGIDRLHPEWPREP